MGTAVAMTGDEHGTNVLNGPNGFNGSTGTMSWPSGHNIPSSLNGLSGLNGSAGTMLSSSPWARPS